MITPKQSKSVQTHPHRYCRYARTSSACWEIFAALSNGGEPPLAPAPLNDLLRDAYAAQHPGTPSDQSIQSVAVHLLALYDVLVHGVTPENALWIRRRAVRDGSIPKHKRFVWLTPPSFAETLTVVEIVQASTPEARTEFVAQYVKSIWATWAQMHGQTIAKWYDRFIVPEKL